MRRRVLSCLAFLCASSVVGTLRAADAPPVPTSEQLAAAVRSDAQPAGPSALPAQPEDAPPSRPRKKGIVLVSDLGGLFFLGRFRQVAPPAPWLHVQGGYELFPWLMVFGEGELAFTDTSIADVPSRQRAFPIFGFGAGGRLTVHPTPRVALFAQGSLGFLKADVARNALGLEGYADAEKLHLQLGGRIGFEWYMVDRHLALGLGGGVRDAKGFAKVGVSDTPIMIDASLALRYTF